MRIRFLQMCAIVVLLSVCVLAQRGPTSPLATPSGNEVSASFVLVAKDTSMNLGNGSYFTATHYFTQHIGLTGNGEFLHVNAYNLDEKLLMLAPPTICFQEPSTSRGRISWRAETGSPVVLAKERAAGITHGPSNRAPVWTFGCMDPCMPRSASTTSTATMRTGNMCRASWAFPITSENKPSNFRKFSEVYSTGARDGRQLSRFRAMSFSAPNLRMIIPGDSRYISPPPTGITTSSDNHHSRVQEASI